VALSQAVENKKLKAFISYSRRDLDFAQRVVMALENRGLAPRIDTRDLPTLEDWRRELAGFIREADAVVFIVSPNSIGSHECAWELDEVARRNKRLAPIVLERVPDDRIPASVAKINYLFFDQPQDFEAKSDALALALQTDLGWLKEHTRLGALAYRWNERKRKSGMLLRGQELLDGERWLAARPVGAPEATRLQRDYIAKSRAMVAVRRAIAGALAVCAVIGGIGAWEWEAWSSVRGHFNLSAYNGYLGRTLPLHLFRTTAEQRKAEDAMLHAVPQDNSERYRIFSEAHSDSPYGRFASLIYQRRVNSKAAQTIFPDSTSRELAADEIDKLSCDETVLAWNEIDYRYGYCFCSTWGNEHFPNADCDGIVDRADADAFAEASIEGIPKANADALMAAFKKHNCQIPATIMTACKATR
jgi:TIR domain/YARHG domain